MKKHNILVVDDDRIILDSLCEFLKLEGYTATGAETIKEALAQLHKQVFSVVVTDVSMPDGSGLGLDVFQVHLSDNDIGKVAPGNDQTFLPRRCNLHIISSTRKQMMNEYAGFLIGIYDKELWTAHVSSFT